MTYFTMQGEDRLHLGDVIIINEVRHVPWWLRLWRMNSSRIEVVEARHIVTHIHCGTAETTRLVGPYTKSPGAFIPVDL